MTKAIKAQPTHTPDSIPPMYRSSTEEITIALKSMTPFVWIRTHEEERVLDEIASIVKEEKMTAHTWSLWQGLVPIANAYSGERANGTYDKTWDPVLALEKISGLKSSKEDDKRGNVVIMRDMHTVLQGPIPRQMRDYFNVLKNNKTKIIILAPTLAHGAGGTTAGLPPTMEKQFTVLDFNLPSREEIEDCIRELIRNVIDHNTKPEAEMNAKQKEALANFTAITQEHYTDFARACQGLTLNEIKNGVAASIQRLRTINTKFLLEQKKQIISKSDILEYVDSPKSMNDIGGLNLLKEYFLDYAFANSLEAQEFGVEPLRGVLIVGVPGTGKSLTAKSIANAYRQPLIRLDVGKVMTGLVGGSEQKMRQAIDQVQSMSPCILWVDEVEKALSGTKSSGFSDGGTTSRVFGTLLTAMEEGLKGVTIVATANDISALPPEFIRRFTEVFFVDLPGPAEREEITRIHLIRKKADPAKFDLKAILDASENFTGAEIEKGIVRALTLAFKDDKVLKTEHIIQALGETKPLFTTMGPQIDTMRKEARGKYRYASTWALEQNAKNIAKKSKMKVDDVDLPKMSTKTKESPKVDENVSELDIE